MKFLYNVLRISIISIFYLVITLNINAQQLTKEQISDLKFRHIGPVGNRLIAAYGIPGNDLVYYAGAASGGIWKTVDGGLNWKPIFDDKPVHAIGALAIASSDSEIIYAGTGESFIRSNVSIGNGVWKSTDGGDNWTHLGLNNTGRIARIIVDPNNPDIVYVAAMGHAYAPQKDRGVFKSSDGGKSWRHVLFIDENTGASDLVMDPSNPRILFAGMWQLSLRTWNRTSGGPGSGIHISRDSGETWKKLEKGLPEGPIGKIALTMTAANPNRVYALIETGDGVETIEGKPESGDLWRSEDKGATWNLINHDRNIGGRQAYYTRGMASPDNENEIYFISASFHSSIDGGKTLDPVSFSSQPNWDHHDIWIDPTNANRMIVAGDGGISISKNRGKSWQRIQLPVAQLYHVTTDTQVPYFVLTNRQDGPSMRGPSRSRVGGFFGTGISTGMWHAVGGGESGFATADPVDPNIVWSSASGFGALGGVVTRFDANTRQFRQVEVWPEITSGHPAEQVKYRFQWTFPVLISPHDHNTVYVTSQMVHRTTNGGQSWEVISPDLSLNDKTMQTKSGGLTPDNIGVEYANVIYAFEESPVQKGVFWAGTNDGLLHVSQDGGQNWENVTKNIKNLPALGTVRNIDASKWSAGKAYITVDFHEVGNFDPHVYKTENFGKSWQKIINGIASGNLSYARNIREDPVRKGLLFLGTENKLYVSFNDGVNWQEFMSNLPHSPMYWLDIPEHFNDLVVGTYGRGIWILDDITPLQQLPQDLSNTTALFFKPKDAYRFQGITSTMQFFPEPSTGQDPPYGASINYWMAKEDSVKMYITTSGGDTVRTVKTKSKVGINRYWWNLESDPITPIKLRTPPTGADWVPLGKDGTRSANISMNYTSYTVPPATYTVKMSAGNQNFSEPLTVIKDPHSTGTISDINAQIDFVKKIYNDINQLNGMINELELIRSQIGTLKKTLSSIGGKKDLISEAGAMDSLLINLESKLIQMKTTGTGQDGVRWPARLAGKYGYLGVTSGIGDFPPADQYVAVYNDLKEKLNAAQSEMNAIKSGALADFQKVLRDNDVGAIIVR